MFKFILDIIHSIIGFKGPKSASNASSGPTLIPTPIREVKMDSKPQIDWLDPKAKVSQYFTVKEALWLPKWNRMASEADGLNEEVKNNLVILFKKMDTIRNYIGKPINVHVAFRSEEYNKLVKGAKASAHLKGMAVDWSSNVGFMDVGSNCDRIRELLEPCLEEWGLRLEDNGKGAPWVHIDTAPVISNRYFKP